MILDPTCDEQTVKTLIINEINYGQLLGQQIEQK